jgi:hypothetical protein
MSTADGVAFDKLCRLWHLAIPVAEYRFALTEGRAWRFDWAWPKHRIALEVEGGAFVRGRHVRGKGYIEDMHKYNTAQLLGWIVLRVTPDALASTRTFDLLQRAFSLDRSHV